MASGAGMRGEAAAGTPSPGGAQGAQERAGAGVVVAIDGPSGSGKSTVARHLAQRYGLAYLDTGAMYRVLTWHCLHADVALEDADAVALAARTVPLAMPLDARDQSIVLDGVDVTEAIRGEEVSTHVSTVATNLAVRATMRELQRGIIAREAAWDAHGGAHEDVAPAPGAAWSGGRGIVAEGRDITTVVAPDAEVRMLLVARPEARLARRALENLGNDDAAALAATRDQVLRRDAEDATVSQFLTASDGVVTLDSTTLTLEATYAAAERVVGEALGEGTLARLEAAVGDGR